MVGAGGGVIDGEGNFVHDSFMHPITQNAAYRPKTIKYSNETAIYLGMFRGVWGHCLTDNIKRLWFLRSTLYQRHFRGCPLVYIPMWDFDFETKCPTFKEMIEILGLSCSDLQPIKEAIQYKNLILPDMSFRHSKYFTNEYRETIDIIRDFALENRRPIPFNRVYFFHGRNQIGEERIAQYFNSKGYAVISPEKLSFKDQLNVVINCDSFAAPIGSASHNMIFLRDNAEVILIPRAFYATGYQETLNAVHNVRITYVDSTLSLFVNNDFPWGGPFYYFLSDKLLRYFADTDLNDFQFSEADFKTFIVYLKICRTHGLKFSAKAMEYYKDVNQNFFDQLKQQTELLKREGIVIN